jgi:hypothetical protein
MLGSVLVEVKVGPSMLLGPKHARLGCDSPSSWGVKVGMDMLYETKHAWLGRDISSSWGHWAYTHYGALGMTYTHYGALGMTYTQCIVWAHCITPMHWASKRPCKEHGLGPMFLACGTGLLTQAYVPGVFLNFFFSFRRFFWIYFWNFFGPFYLDTSIHFFFFHNFI